MPKPGRLALLILATLLIPIIPFVVIGELPGERWLSTQDDNAAIYGLLAMGLLSADVLLPVPSSVMGTLLGARLGFPVGWLLTWIGLTIGHAVGYLLGRALMSRWGQDLTAQPTLVVVLLSRPVPVLAEAATFAAGAARLPWWSFLAVAGAGNAVYSAALAASGAALLADDLAGPGLIIPLSIPVLGWLAWRRFSRKPPSSTSS